MLTAPSPVAGQPTAAPGKLTVRYNTKCPVCNAGINWQRNRLVRAARAGVIEFRDINLEPDALARFGAGLEDIRRRLHGVDSAGQLYVGADCAVEVWRRTPGDAWLAAIASVPGIRWLSRRLYDGFASLLYTWNKSKRHW
jgi:predicted DCC family thiol-disulfide oxidoreductase YuxK